MQFNLSLALPDNGVGQFVVATSSHQQDSCYSLLPGKAIGISSIKVRPRRATDSVRGNGHHPRGAWACLGVGWGVPLSAVVIAWWRVFADAGLGGLDHVGVAAQYLFAVAGLFWACLIGAFFNLVACFRFSGSHARSVRPGLNLARLGVMLPLALVVVSATQYFLTGELWLLP